MIGPSREVADFLASTYSFDEVLVEPVTATRSHAWLGVTAPSIQLRARIERTSILGRLPRLVPRRIAVHPVWLTVVDPVVRLLSPGTRTAGSAGAGRREFYGVTTARRVHEVDGQFRGEDFGGLTRLRPRVTFGFGSPPTRPSLVAVTTTIRMPPALT